MTLSIAPKEIDGHGLLNGKVVVVTAAAGTGIGFATAKRCAEEGATVAISDRHERRLAESAERLAEVMGAQPVAVPCDVTVEADVQRMFDAVGVDRLPMFEYIEMMQARAAAKQDDETSQ